jgi:hypothetical protein
MNYTLLIYENPAEFAARTDPEKKDAYRAARCPRMPGAVIEVRTNLPTC